MTLRSAVVVAGLVLGTMSGTARSASLGNPFNFTLQLDIRFDSSFINLLHPSVMHDTGDLSIKVSGTTSQGGTFVTEKGDDYALTGTVRYDAHFPILDYASFSGFVSGNTNVTGDVPGITDVRLDVLADEIDLYDYSKTTLYYQGPFSGYASFEVDGIPFSGDNSEGTATLTLTPVPLPSSAPMFGGALLSLAGLGYMAKRKNAAAAT